MMQKMCQWTNTYVEQKIKAKAASFQCCNGWTPLRVSELQGYFAIVLMQHLYEIPLKAMWSKTDKRCFCNTTQHNNTCSIKHNKRCLLTCQQHTTTMYRVEAIASTMSRSRFLDIHWHLRFSQVLPKGTKPKKQDHLISWLVDKFNKHSKKYWRPGRFYAIDDCMVPNKCRSVFFHFNPRKPHKNGSAILSNYARH